MKRLLLCSLLIAHCSLIFAYDIGLVLDQSLIYRGSGSDNVFEVNGVLIPSISGLIGNTGEYFISAGFNYQSNPWGYIPELIEASLFLDLNYGFTTIGRMRYADPLGFISDGFFDGAQIVFDTRAGVFGLGAWYTGLICKRRANIEMTYDEWVHNKAAIDYSDFFDTYFAPRRLISSLEWEHPAIARHLGLNVSLLGQFDLSGEGLNTYYLTLKKTMPFRGFNFHFGSCLQLIHYDGDIDAALAAEMGLSWIWRRQGLSFLARYSSGEQGPLTPFLPVTTVAQGEVIDARLSGLTVFSLDYTARLHRTFSFNFMPSYFIDNGGYNRVDNDGGLLGGEIFGKLNWSPFSDIMLSLGGGVFLPSLGNVARTASNIWRTELNLIVSFF